MDNRNFYAIIILIGFSLTIIPSIHSDLSASGQDPPHEIVARTQDTPSQATFSFVEIENKITALETEMELMKGIYTSPHARMNMNEILLNYTMNDLEKEIWIEYAGEAIDEYSDYPAGQDELMIRNGTHTIPEMIQSSIDSEQRALDAWIKRDPTSKDIQRHQMRIDFLTEFKTEIPAQLWTINRNP